MQLTTNVQNDQEKKNRQTTHLSFMSSRRVSVGILFGFFLWSSLSALRLGKLSVEVKVIIFIKISLHYVGGENVGSSLHLNLKKKRSCQTHYFVRNLYPSREHYISFKSVMFLTFSNCNPPINNSLKYASLEPWSKLLLGIYFHREFWHLKTPCWLKVL